MEFQIVSWDSRDIDHDGDQRHQITMYGRDECGQSVVAKCLYNPSFYIEMTKPYQSKTMFLSDLNMVIGARYGPAQGQCAGLMGTEVVHREKFYGFTNHTRYRFLKLTFANKASWKKAFYHCRNNKTYASCIYEANIDPVLRFIHDCDIESTGWVELEAGGYYVQPKELMTTFSDREVLIKHPKHIRARRDLAGIAPVVLCSFDIEVYSQDHSFPDASSEENYCPIIQIANAYERYGGDGPYCHELHTLQACDGPIVSWTAGVVVLEYASEAELLQGWVRSIQEHNPDLLIGYNIWKFDLHYIMQRAERLNMAAFLNLNKEKDEGSRSYAAKFSSSAYGDNDYNMVTSTGRMQLDLLELYKREHKLIKYSLNFVSDHFLKEAKLDMPIKELFARFEARTAMDMVEIGKYCVQDTLLPLRLMRHLNNIPNLMEMAKATFVPMHFLLERGQQIKVFSQITKETQKANMLVITPTDAGRKETFTGATVLNAEKDAYMDCVVTGLDFASLYPTIMRAHNLCYSTIVRDASFDQLSDVEYETFAWNSNDTAFSYTFAQSTPGILPKLLENLAQNRKQAKRDMATHAADPTLYNVYNGKQLAFKVSMNSIYGFCAAYMLPCQPISATVTTIGRNMIEKTKNLVEEWYPGSRVIYGDSVVGDTPLVLRYMETVFTQRVDSLWNLFEKHAVDGADGKCSIDMVEACAELDVWSDTGFTTVKRMIRHKTTKRIFRIVTRLGLLDVTEDHSLLTEQKAVATPHDVSVGSRLCHRPPVYEKWQEDMVTGNEAFLMGVFLGTGWCCKTRQEWYIKVPLSKKSLLVDMQMVCPFATCTPYPTGDVYTMKLANEERKGHIVVSKYRRMFYNEFGHKKVPVCILLASPGLLEAFFHGYYGIRGQRGQDDRLEFDMVGKEAATGFVLVCQRLGYECALHIPDTTNTDPQMPIRVVVSKTTFQERPNEIQQMMDLGVRTEYVYDLETESHHFHVGPGDTIVHNTDSVMVVFPTTTQDGAGMLQESFRLGQEAADRISQTFKRPIELEFEKCYYPYLLFSKKRYAGLMYTRPDKPDYIDAKGIQLVRRDNPDFVKQVCKKVLHMIMYDRQVYEAMVYAQECGRQLLQGQVSVQDLVLSKSLRKTYTCCVNARRLYEASPTRDVQLLRHTCLPHVHVSHKIASRTPGSEPRAGDRVPYIFVDTKDKHHLQYEKAEDPGYALEHRLPIDVLYYLEHSLSSPLASLFELFMDKPAEELFGDMVRKHRLKQDGQRQLHHFFAPAPKRPTL